MKNLFLFTFIWSVSIFSSQAQIIKTIAGGSEGYSGDNGPEIAAQFFHPDVLRFDYSGNMYIADELNDVVRKINIYGTITTIAGTGKRGFSGDGGPAINAQLRGSSDVIFDKEGNVYVSHFGAIRKINSAGIITTIAGTGAIGFSGAEGAATSIPINDPLGLVFDNTGNLYFSDNGTYRIRKLSPSGILTTVAGTGTTGYSGDNGPAISAQIGDVGYLAMDKEGNLYLPDYDQRVRKIDVVTGIITTVAGNGVNSYAGDGLPATQASLKMPIAVMFDPKGNMYISDAIAYTVRKVDLTGVITTVAGNGTTGFSGDNGPATNAQFGDYINCSAIDPSGNLYIADAGNNRIRRITYNATAIKNVTPGEQCIAIVPNPAHKTITIKAPAAEVNKDVMIVNAIGQQVYRQFYTGGEIDVSSLAAGLYFVKVDGLFAARFVKD